MANLDSLRPRDVAFGKGRLRVVVDDEFHFDL